MRSFIGISALALALAGCGDDQVMVMGGSLELNQKLRADMASSVSTASGRFFASGDCAGATPQDECNLVSAVQASFVNAENALFTSRLRRAPFLWVEGDGFARLSYEFVGRGVNIVLQDDPTESVASDVDVGTCHGFPVSHPDTREPIEGLEEVDEETSRAYTQMFDVTVHSCTSGASTNPETLEPQIDECASQSASELVANDRPHPGPQNPPLCVVGLAALALDSDVSFKLEPGTQPGVNLLDLWSGISVSPFPILPHLRIVPVGGTRTISRRMERSDQRRMNPDGSVTHFFTWRVPIESGQWTENFSPNVVVTRARVRRGAWSPTNRDYFNLEGLEVGNVRCPVRVPATADTEFDITMCGPSPNGTFRVTPSYRFDFLMQQRLDDGDRLLWDARVNVSRSTLDDDDQLFLELDLTALLPVGTSGSGLMADPGGRDLGSIRTGPSTASQPGFMLHNIGSVSAYVESITLTGRNAAEFGSVQLQRVSAPGSGIAGAAPATFSAPFIFLAGSRVEARVLPAFQTIGEKQADVVITARDVRNVPQTIRVALQATAVSPLINVLPATVYLYATPGLNGYASARRAAIMTNDGPIAFQRTGVHIDGPNAAEFRVLAGEYGLGASDLSRPLTIGSGEAEIYRVGFFPTGTSTREATLRIDTNEGQLSIALRGACDEGCQQPPAPPQLEPGPEVPTAAVKITYPKVKIRKGTLKKPKPAVPAD